MYRGNTEDERIECALHAQNIDEIGYYLANMRLLTNNKNATLQLCRSLFVIDQPEQEDPQEEEIFEPVPNRQPATTSPAAAAPKRKTMRQVEQ
jgi:hypothetical protein